MSSFVESAAEFEGVRAVEYRAAYVYEGDDYRYPMPARVAVAFGNLNARLVLDPADAEALIYGLAVALVEHAVAVKVSPSDPKAVA